MMGVTVRPQEGFSSCPAIVAVVTTHTAVPRHASARSLDPLPHPAWGPMFFVCEFLRTKFPELRGGGWPLPHH